MSCRPASFSNVLALTTFPSFVTLVADMPRAIVVPPARVVRSLYPARPRVLAT